MKSIIITGATSGIGYECALHLAKTVPGKQIIIACRNQRSGNEVIKKIMKLSGHRNMVSLPLSLDSLQSVRDFKTVFERTGHRISALINNAGVQVVGKTTYTEDGFEETCGVNHLGPLYLTLLLLPLFAENGRITFTASGTHDPKQKTGMPAPEFKDPRTLAYPDKSLGNSLSVGQRRYTTSKMCNIMTVYQLQKYLSGTSIHVNAFDPGLVPGTGLTKSYPPLLKFVADYGFRVLILFHPNVNTARTSGTRLANLACSTKYRDANGKYFEGEKEIKSSTDSYDQEYQDILWKSSIELLGMKSVIRASFEDKGLFV